MKGQRLKYNGNLTRGRNSDSPDTPVRWHVADNPTAAGDFIACGVAMEELEEVAESFEEETEDKIGGYCTCPDCIDQINGWLEIIKNCPGIMAKLKEKQK